MNNHSSIPRKRYKLDLALWLLIFTIVGQWYLIYENQKRINNLQAECSDTKQMLSLLNGNMEMHYAYTGWQLQDATLFNKNKEAFKLSSLVKGKEKLILKYSPENCSSCIQFCTEMIKRMSLLTSYNDLAIIISDAQFREFQVISNELESEIPIYLTYDTIFKPILKKENIPFIFVINEDLRMKDLFIPIKEIPNFSSKYLRLMQKKYFPEISTFN